MSSEPLERALAIVEQMSEAANGHPLRLVEVSQALFEDQVVRPLRLAAASEEPRPRSDVDRETLAAVERTARFVGRVNGGMTMDEAVGLEDAELVSDIQAILAALPSPRSDDRSPSTEADDAEDVGDGYADTTNSPFAAPRSDDREGTLLQAVRVLAPIAHLWEPDDSHRRTGGPVLGDFALCGHPRCQSANRLLARSAPDTEPEWPEQIAAGRLVDAVISTGCLRHRSPHPDDKTKCAACRLRRLAMDVLDTAVAANRSDHSAPDTVDEPTP